MPSQIAGDYQYRADYLTGDGPHAIGSADLDFDGHIDIVTADYNMNNVSVLLNDGTGVFTQAGQFPTGDGPRSLALADIDSDNDVDIVTANWRGDTVSVLKNNGDGTFPSHTEYDVDAGPYSVFLADIGEDGNSDVDVIVAADQADRVSVLENDGSGGFGNMKSLKVGARPKGVFAVDMDGDGAVDIASANWADNTVSVLQNKGDGTFFNHVEYDTGSSPRSIYMAPLNNDIRPDIVCANQHDNTVSVIMNDGDGTFGAKTDYAVGENPLSVFCGDVDGDGDSDILTANLLNDSVTVLYNNGFGNFPERTDFETGWGPYQVLLSEVNKDGKVDIISTNSYGDSISVRYSNFPPSITIVEPDGESDTANASYSITWQDFDPEADASISLFWDDDESGLDGTLIASGLSEDDDGIGGIFSWDISGMPGGDYFIYARIEDGTFEPLYDYSSGFLTIDHSYVANSPPTFQITDPDGQNDVADTQFTITWMDSDPDDDAEISLFYDDNADGFDGTLIAGGLSEDLDGGFGHYVWNTSFLPYGSYFLYGICDDGTNDPVSRYSPNPVTVNHSTQANDPPNIRITEPDGNNDYANTQYMITWIDSDVDDDAQISLYHDSDTFGYDGILIAGSISENEYGSSGAYIWDTSLLTEGQYFIYGVITDGTSEARDYSSGGILVSRNGTFNTAPRILEISPAEGVVEVHDNYTIHWVDLDPDDDANISFYYDSDQVGNDGVLIVTGISEDDVTDSYIWDTGNVPEGMYYIYGKIHDGVNNPSHDYSRGILKITHGSRDEQEIVKHRTWENLSVVWFLIIIALLLLIILMLHNRKMEKAGNKLEDFSKEEHEELGKPKEEPLSGDTEDEVDEDLLPPPDDFEEPENEPQSTTED